jgi:hypothetical protein
MVELIFEVFSWSIYWFIGALVGVLWPPKSQAWSQWQKVAMVLGVSAVATYSLAFGTAYFRGWTATAWGFFALACTLSVGYMIVGNICRAFHESTKDACEAKGRPTRDTR